MSIVVARNCGNLSTAVVWRVQSPQTVYQPRLREDVPCLRIMSGAHAVSTLVAFFITNTSSKNAPHVKMTRKGGGKEGMGHNGQNRKTGKKLIDKRTTSPWRGYTTALLMLSSLMMYGGLYHQPSATALSASTCPHTTHAKCKHPQKHTRAEHQVTGTRRQVSVSLNLDKSLTTGRHLPCW